MESKQERKVPCFDFSKPDTYIHMEDMPTIICYGPAAFSGTELERIARRGMRKYGDALEFMEIQSLDGEDVNIKYVLHHSRTERICREELRALETEQDAEPWAEKKHGSLERLGGCLVRLRHWGDLSKATAVSLVHYIAERHKIPLEDRGMTLIEMEPCGPGGPLWVEVFVSLTKRDGEKAEESVRAYRLMDESPAREVLPLEELTPPDD